MVVSPATVPLPLVIARKEWQYQFLSDGSHEREHRESYYFWLFGPMVRFYVNTEEKVVYRLLRHRTKIARVTVHGLGSSGRMTRCGACVCGLPHLIDHANQVAAAND
jgi:hypothetical protein